MRAKEIRTGVFQIVDKHGEVVLSECSEDCAIGYIIGWRDAQGGVGCGVMMASNESKRSTGRADDGSMEPRTEPVSDPLGRQNY